jgi:predicted TPR repeat methyltransferase
MSTRVFMSSGDTIADRRFDFARDLLLRGDLQAAEELLQQAVELVPTFTSAWFALGDTRERRGDHAGAIAAFQSAADSDTADRHGASLRLIRLGGAAPVPMPQSYLRTLYDQYAPRFEASLLGNLGYRGPSLLFKAVLAVRVAAGKPALFRRVIDLGCGTGLAGRAFAAQADDIIGIDLSPRMAELARATGLYREVLVADVLAGLRQQPPAQFDLAIAADVAIYLHDLAPVFAETAWVLAAGGLLAFTVETHAGEGVVLGQGLRYAHGADYVRACLQHSGLRELSIDHASARNEGGQPVPGLVVVAEKP